MDRVERLLSLGPPVRYVAWYEQGRLSSACRPGLQGGSDEVSDRFEELLVNPTLITLTRQHGNIDCGGLDSLLVRYGNFTQLVVPIPEGHVSIALDPDADLSEWEDRLKKLVATLAKAHSG